MLPTQDFDGLRTGGLSALVHDAKTNTWVALSDDPAALGPVRAFRLTLSLHGAAVTPSVVGVTRLHAPGGLEFGRKEVDPEGLALLPDGTWAMSSEGVANARISPFIARFDPVTGQHLGELAIPDALLPNREAHGVRENYGLEALSSCEGTPVLLAMVEAPLQQDGPWPVATAGSLGRVLRFNMSTPPRLEAQFAYPLEGNPVGSLVAGVTSVLCLDGGARFLVLERSWGADVGFGIKLFLADMQGAQDVGDVDVLPANVLPVKKTLLLDVASLGVRLDNFEGLALGPMLPDGRRLLMVVSDDNFQPTQVTEFLAFAWAG